jgi:hypothetical protein
MVTIIEPRSNRDTRGLPEGYDPHMLYEYRFQSLRNQASGLEWYLYKYIPIGLIKSFAFAIDPTAPFKVAPGVITPENRTKYRTVSSVLLARRIHHTRFQQAFAPLGNYNGVSGCHSPYVVYGTPVTSNYYVPAIEQQVLESTLKDTTSRTRLIGSTQGTLTMFKAFINSPARSASTVYTVGSSNSGIIPPPNDPCIVNAGGTYKNRDGGSDTYRSSTDGAGATLSAYHYSLIKDSEIAYNVGLSQAHAIEMIKGYSPFNRDYSLFRNLAELRDIPHSISSLKSTMFDLRKAYVSLSSSPSLRKIVFDLKSVAKDIPNEYLSYHFGWKQTYNDIVDLLAAPYKLSKRLNFLIARSGKPTTFRSKRNFISGGPGVSGFDYELIGDESFSDSSDGYQTRLERESELRLVINATFDFPPISSPRFRQSLWTKRLGIEPRVTDVYNLVPWTWLVDYFTGFGNYVECIDNLNHDPSLINWGVLTCVTKGKYITDFRSTSYRYNDYYADGVHTVSTSTKVRNQHTSILDYTCETRRDVATILDVNTTSEPTSLSAYQKSIIGALLAQRTDFSRKRAFSPRS